MTLTFTRLPEIDPDLITAHLTDPRVTRHLPLMPPTWDAAATQAFVAAKEACWTRDGLGHWAFLQDGRYVGWGGFQREGGEWDFGLVLTAEAFGLGFTITRQALAFAMDHPDIPHVTFLLPPSRTKLAALKRLGARPVGTATHDGATFQKFAIATPQRA